MRIRPVFLISGIIAVALVSLALVLLLRKTDLSQHNDICAQQVEAALQTAGIVAPPTHAERETIKTFRTINKPWHKEYAVPLSTDMVKLMHAISQDPHIENYLLTRINRKRTKQHRTITLEFAEPIKKTSVYYLTLKQPLARGTLAIVLDDWGYNKKVFDDSLALPPEVTYAILPNLPYSREIARELNNLKREYILHQPMEPHNADNIKLEQNTLMTGMTREELISITEQNIATIPGLKGINNHMGSCATENSAVMDAVFRLVKQQGLYFLDSVTGKTVCGEVARKHNIPFLKRDIFLDNANDRNEIIARLREAVALAKQNGTAIAIGHARPLTVTVLTEQLPGLEAEGILLVRASRLLTTPHPKDRN